MNFEQYKFLIEATHGSLCAGQPEWLFEESMKACVRRPGCHILEIGSFCGKSATCLGIPAREMGGTLHCFDPFDPHNGTFWRYCSNIIYAGLSGTVHLEKRASDEAFARLDPSVRFELVFIDGNHTEEYCYRDIMNAIERTHTGGVIACHDYLAPGWEGVGKAWDKSGAKLLKPYPGCGTIVAGKKV